MYEKVKEGHKISLEMRLAIYFTGINMESRNLL